MTQSDSESITLLLEAAHRGDKEATEQLRPLVHERLRRLAHRVRDDPGDMGTAPLVKEAYEQLVGQEQLHWINRYHFYKAAALAMRRILVEAAREGSGNPKSSVHRILSGMGPDAAALEEALDRLQRIDTLVCDVVQMRYLAGLSVQDTARALEVSEETVEKKWNFGRAWLHQELNEELSSSP